MDKEQPDDGRTITCDEIAHIRRILDTTIETDDDYAELLKLVEDESERIVNA